MFASNEPGFFNYFVATVILLIVAGYWAVRLNIMVRHPDTYKAMLEREKQQEERKYGLIGTVLGLVFRK